MTENPESQSLLNKVAYPLIEQIKDALIAVPSLLMIGAAIALLILVEHWMRYVCAAALGLPGIFILLRIIHRANMQLGLTGRNTEVEKKRIEEFKRAWASKKDVRRK
jgi:hypothetical protein